MLSEGYNKEILKLRTRFEKNRDKIFLIDAINDCKFKYGEIEDLSLRLASLLNKIGIKRREKVVILLPNCPEFVVIYFACMQIGAIAVPINIKLHLEEIQYILSKSEARALFFQASLKKTLKNCLDSFPAIKLLPLEPTNGLDTKNKLLAKGNKIKRFDFFSKFAHEAKYSEMSFQKIGDEDIAIIVFTSGTTKRPKGVLIPYKSIIRNGLTFSKQLGLGQNLRFYEVLPLSYLGGFYNLMMIPFFIGGSIVLDHIFNPTTALNFWDKVEKYKVNALWLVPSIISALLILDRSDTGKNYCRNHIRIALVGTAPLFPVIKKKFEKKYSLKLYENYGLSETLFVSTNSPKVSNNRGVGKLLAGCQVSIVDEAGQVRKVNERGEIVVKSPYLTSGYYKNKEEEKISFKGDKFYTGDIGYMDKESFLYITDRKKDLIIRGGINISPKEIEEVIAIHPLVNEVVVVGIPHALYGEEVVAVVSAKVGLNKRDIIQLCRNHLAIFKIPKKVVFVKELPRGVTGKVQKNKIKEIVLAGEN